MRKRLAIWLIIFFLAIFTQSFWLSLFPWMLESSLILVFLLFFFIFSQVEERCLFKIFLGSGILVDILFFYPIGFHAVSFLLTFALLSFFSEKIFSVQKENPVLSGLVLVIVASFFEQCAELLLGRILHIFGKDSLVRIGAGEMIGNLLFVAGAFLILYPLFRKISEKLSFKNPTLTIKK
ncbi:MAG: hypothetical protein ACOYS2_03165 [Patescibacteria group bacterium]